MSARTRSTPDLRRGDASAPKFGPWLVGSAARQRAAAQAVAAAWTSRPWPTPDLRAYCVFNCTDGDTMVHFSQWTDDEAYHRFARTSRDRRLDEVVAVVPGVRRFGPASYRLQRSRQVLPDTVEAGFYVAGTVDFGRPDAGRQRAWVEAACHAVEARGEPVGLIADHFHVSADGRRVLNLAEWTGEEAHRSAVRASGELAGTMPRGLPGAPCVTVQLFRLAVHLAPGPDGRTEAVVSTR